MVLGTFDSRVGFHPDTFVQHHGMVQAANWYASTLRLDDATNRRSSSPINFVQKFDHGDDCITAKQLSSETGYPNEK